MARVLVEHVFGEPLSDEQFASMGKRVDPCLEVRNGAWRRSSLSLDRKKLVCEFEAPDADSVREALRAAAVPYERVWGANVFAVEDYPDALAKLNALVAR
jgi:hypothetical protein